MNILLAEDDSTSRDLMRRIIALRPGCTLVQARDGEEAWQILREPGRRFDVGIFDVTMPRVDGITLLERVRASAIWRSLPVILCTAINDRQTVERACLLSVSHYIVKPYTRALVLEKLQFVAADLQSQAIIDDATVVADRLGVEVSAVGELARNVITETRQWVAAARLGRAPGEFREMAIKANALKGAALNLGLRALSQALDRIETTFVQDFGSETRVLFPPSASEVDIELDTVDAQLTTADDRLTTAA